MYEITNGIGWRLRGTSEFGTRKSAQEMIDWFNEHVDDSVKLEIREIK